MYTINELILTSHYCNTTIDLGPQIFICHYIIISVTFSYMLLSKEKWTQWASSFVVSLSVVQFSIIASFYTHQITLYSSNFLSLLHPLEKNIILSILDLGVNFHSLGYFVEDLGRAEVFSKRLSNYGLNFFINNWSIKYKINT